MHLAKYNRKPNKRKKEEKKETKTRSTHSKPRHTNHNVQPLLLGPGVLERPHAIAVDIPKGASSGMQPALASVTGAAVRRGSLVDEALLDDGAVDGKAVRGWC